MKILKKDLTEALKKARGFVGKGSDIMRCIKLDGHGQVLVATDLNATIEVPLKITHYVREVEVPAKAPAIPGEAFIAELNKLTVGPLKERCEAAGLKPGKKAEMVEALYQQAKTEAEKQAAEAKPTIEKVTERLVVNFNQFSSMVRTLDLKDDENVVLAVEQVEVLGELLVSYQDTLTVGGVFQNIPVEPLEDFPVLEDFEGTNIGELKGSELARVATAYPREVTDDTPDWKINTIIDRENNAVVATDGTRVHIQNATLKGDGAMYVETEYVARVAKLAGSEAVKIAVADDHRHVIFSVGDTDVWVVADDDMNTMDWKKLLDDRDGEQTVMIKNATLKRLFDQAGVVASKKSLRADLTFNGSLNIEAVSDGENEEKRVRYENFEVPYESGTIDGTQERGINVKYMSQALRGFDKKVTIGIAQGLNDPLRFTDENKTFTALIAPIAVKVKEVQSDDSDTEVAEAA